jgi:hypothetical protein
MMGSFFILNAQTYRATVTQTINGGNLDVSLYLEHTGTTSPVLGDCSFYLNFNSSALSSPVLQSDGQWDGDHNAGYDQNAVFAGVGIVGYEIVLNGTPTYQIPDSPTLLGTIRFTIDNTSLNSGISWRTGSPFPCEVNDVSDADITSDGTFTNPGDFSLPVQMSSIEGESTVDGIELRWETASEVGSAGFHVWRSETADGDYERITTSLIPGQGNSSSGATYNFTDKNYEGNATYYYRIEQVDADGGSEMFSAIEVTALFIPTEYVLSQNYPNPFNPSTTFTYDVPEVSDVTIRVYSLLGKEVRTLYSKQQMPGRYTEVWDGTDNSGRKLASGVYFLRMQAGSFSKLRKMTLIR